MTAVAWPSVATVQVELVPTEHRRGPLATAVWVAVRRLPDHTQRVHLPEDDDERAMHPVEYGRLVAAATGARFNEPPPWLSFTRTDEATWSAWDTRRCGPHGLADCPAASCADEDNDSDVTVPPVPALTLTRPEVLV